MATLRFMRSLRVRRLYVLSDTSPASTPYDSAIGHVLAAAAPGAGIALAGVAGVDTGEPNLAAAYPTLLARIAATHADAVLLAGAPDRGGVVLYEELHAELPSLKLFAPSTLATGHFLSSLGSATAAATYVTSPILPLDRYPPSAQAVLGAYRRAFGVAPTAYSLYGYEAMSSTLAAITRAGANASKRLAVIHDYFTLGVRHSVIGTYRIEPDGDSTLDRFAGYRAGAGGKLTELALFSG